MPWFRVDDGFSSSRQVLSITKRQRAAAVGLWTLAGAWSAHELTDGYVPDYMLSELAGTRGSAECLVAAGLWDQMENGYVFRQWSKYNPTADQVRSDRAAAREKKRRQRRDAAGKYAETDGQRTGERLEHVSFGLHVSSDENGSDSRVPTVGRRDTSTTSDDPELSLGDMLGTTEGTPEGRPEGSPTVPTRPDPYLKKETTSDGEPEGFAEFWKVYPKRADKGHARKAFAKALGKASADEITAGAERYRDDPTRKPDYTKNAATWLNGECWSDESATPAKATSGPRIQFD